MNASAIKQLIQLASGPTLLIIPEDVRRDGRGLLDHLTARGAMSATARPRTCAFCWASVKSAIASQPCSLRRHCAACSSDATMVERPGARVGDRASHGALTGSTRLWPAVHAAVSLMIAAVLAGIWLLSGHR